jgi:hypothetical protein
MKLELTNNELTGLQQEIQNALPKINKEGGQPLKFHLTVLYEKASESLKPFNKLKEEFIKEKGTQTEDGGYTLQQYKDISLPPTENNFTEEFKEFTELLNEKTEITFKLIPISYFEKLNSEAIYPILSKFVEL